MNKKGSSLLFVLSLFVISCSIQKAFVAKEGLNGLLVYEEHLKYDKEKDPVKRRTSRPSIILSKADGTEQTVLAEYGVDPKWFPSGDRIVYFVPEISPDFSSIRAEHGHSVIVDLKGKILEEVPNHVNSISPDGSFLLVEPGYSSNHSRTGYDIFIYDIKEKQLKKILGFKDLPEQMNVRSLNNPKWFPDGKNILFELFTPIGSSEFSNFRLFGTVNNDGTGFQQITHIPGKVSKGDPTGPYSFDISPDGKKVVFEQTLWEEPHSYGQLFIMNSDGTHLKQLTTDKTGKSDAIWSPDGTKIMYVENFTPGTETDHGETLMVMNPDGTNPRRIFPAPLGYYFSFLPFTYFEWADHPDWWSPLKASRGQTGSK